MFKQYFKKYYKLIIWCGVIFVLSSIPSAKISSDTFLDFVVRKFLHIFEYFILTILSYNTFKSHKSAYFFALVYAISDEVHQMFVPGRGPSLKDVLVDSIGIIMGLLLIWKNYYQKLPKKIQELLN